MAAAPSPAPAAGADCQRFAVRFKPQPQVFAPADIGQDDMRQAIAAGFGVPSVYRIGHVDAYNELRMNFVSMLLAGEIHSEVLNGPIPPNLHCSCHTLQTAASFTLVLVEQTVAAVVVQTAFALARRVEDVPKVRQHSTGMRSPVPAQKGKGASVCMSCT